MNSQELINYLLKHFPKESALVFRKFGLQVWANPTLEQFKQAYIKFGDPFLKELAEMYYRLSHVALPPSAFARAKGYEWNPQPNLTPKTAPAPQPVPKGTFDKDKILDYLKTGAELFTIGKGVYDVAKGDKKPTVDTDYGKISVDDRKPIEEPKKQIIKGLDNVLLYGIVLILAFGGILFALKK